MRTNTGGLRPDAGDADGDGGNDDDEEEEEGDGGGGDDADEDDDDGVDDALADTKPFLHDFLEFPEPLLSPLLSVFLECPSLPLSFVAMLSNPWKNRH